MKQFILALGFGLAPFLSLADNIFTNGAVITTGVLIDSQESYSCYGKSGFTGRVGDLGACKTQQEAKFKEGITGDCGSKFTDYTNETETSVSMRWEYHITKIDVTDGSEYCSMTGSGSGNVYIANPVTAEVIDCPHPDNPSNTYPVDLDGNGTLDATDMCANPFQIDQVDDCNPSSNDALALTAVTVQSGCSTLPNGSVCKYDAVDVGGGNQVYQIDLEHSCYQQPLDEIDFTNDTVEVPNYNESMGDFQCMANGGLLTCAEMPENVTDPDTGEQQQGCGTVNGSFVCVSPDTDNDTLPDYLDPDIDGDGVRNDDDLDADGDGVDDVTRPNDGNDNGGGGTTVEVDMTPVVSELKEINDSISKTEVTLNKTPTEGLVSFWESDYEDGLNGVFEEKVTDFKSSEFYVFLDEFKPNVSGGRSPDYNWCFNFGTNMNLGCYNLSIDPRVFPALKAFILISAAFACRAIMFGG